MPATKGKGISVILVSYNLPIVNGVSTGEITLWRSDYPRMPMVRVWDFESAADDGLVRWKMTGDGGFTACIGHAYSGAEARDRAVAWAKERFPAERTAA